MKDKKLQVFVSSTFTDLKEERQAAVEAILSSGNIPAGMELFSAGDESQMTVIKRWIDESDIYLLILGGRYGSIEPNSGKSYTQLEYEYALSQNKPLFSVVINQTALENKVKDNGTCVIEQDNVKELRLFREIVLTNLVKFFDDKKDIKIAIHETLSDFAYRKELIGWIRGDNNINTAALAEEIARLTKENSELRNQNSKNNNVLYSNLTFEELRKLLESSIYLDPEININLFEYIVEYGSRFIESVYLNGDELDYLKKFFVYKILEKSNFGIGLSHEVKFTDNGHNFYLKALSNRNEK
ncbi:MAG: DUF4062 domain-containing protein [Paludibacter sp.]|jgi:hypothetical protein|nr:DUF4062 domain-containing protein [Paludibacter sp.]